jgi:outer membrane protein assembly factor BamB
MTKSFTVAVLFALGIVASVSGETESRSVSDANWPQWRGPRFTGVAANADPPVFWSENKNIRWKTGLPGLGHSTPIVWEDRIFVTAAIPYGEAMAPRFSGAPGAHGNLPVTHRHEFLVLCIDRSDGSIVWQRTVAQELPHEGGYSTASLVSNSSATDGERLYAFFGSRGLYCLDFDGNVLWEKQFGRMRTKHGHGEGSSPAVYGEILIINWDHEGQSFIAAFDGPTGEPRWKVDRDEKTSWASPIVVEHRGRAQLVVSGTKRVRSYDLADGRVIWECSGLSDNVVASPVAGDGMVFAGSSYDHRALLAIRLEGANGDITHSENLVWTRTRGTPYIPSLLLYDSHLYFLRHFQGRLTRVRANTGEDAPGEFRLHGIRNVYSSPVAAAGRIYITDLDGATAVFTSGREPRLLALNRLDDSIAASAAIVGDELFLRGAKYLYCIQE